MKNANIKIAPSILSADFSKMGDEVQKLQDCGADIIHCDVMDGVFVPNITFGIKMIRDIKKHTSLPLDCHLMIVNPEKYIKRFAEAGADYITVHYEACNGCAKDVLNSIKSLGCKAGLAIHPDTDPRIIKDLIPYCDLVLIMSVFPGFGGQTFIYETLKSVEYVKNEIDSLGANIEIEIDGGINFDTVKLAKNAGVNIVVAGNTVFSAEDKKFAIEKLKAD